ncbi:MAG: transcriptional regulator NrdR [Coriobacteriia bacterium]|nr:transcriptional regulator NrdR [Coriobacteriia bacterium]
MRCPNCGFDDSKVVDTRTTEGEDAIRRRRECLECQTRFTTYERREEQPITVIKKDRTTEPFDRTKLMRGIMTACTKRPITSNQIDALITDIESTLQNAYQYEIESTVLGDMVLVRLRELDPVAYVRFASVYKAFQDLEEFNQELLGLS